MNYLLCLQGVSSYFHRLLGPCSLKVAWLGITMLSAELAGAVRPLGAKTLPAVWQCVAALAFCAHAKHRS